MKKNCLTKEEINKVLQAIELFYTGNKSGPQICKENNVSYHYFNYYKKKLEAQTIVKIVEPLKEKKHKKEEKMSKKDKANWDGIDEQLEISGLKPIKDKTKENPLNGADLLGMVNKIYGI